MGPRRKGCEDSKRVRGTKTDKGLPVSKAQYSKLFCVRVCVKERKREKEGERKQRVRLELKRKVNCC